MTKKPAAPKVQPMPDYLFVYRQCDGDDYYFIAEEHIEGIVDDTLVGVYLLEDHKVKRTTHVLAGVVLVDE